MVTRFVKTAASASLLVLTITLWCTRSWSDVLHEWLVQLLTYPTNALVIVRRPSQIVLLLWISRLGVMIATLLVFSWKRLGQLRWLHAALVVGFVVRGAIWIIGGNLPIVEADSAHHWCVADAIASGNGPTLDYVASFFRVYPRFGMVDDWSMPLWAYYLAGAFLLVGKSLAVAKAATFLVNIVSIIAIYVVARRFYGARSATAAALCLAVFPPHAIYASLILKESLCVFLSIVAAGLVLATFDEQTKHPSLLALAAGLATGLTVLSRRTGLAISAAMLLFGLTCSGKARTRLLFVWGIATGAVVAPWAWATYVDYGVPLYSYTNNFKYMSSWPDHWIYRGEPTLEDYLSQSLSHIIQTKLAMLWIVVSHYWFTLTPALTLSLFSKPRRLWTEPMARLVMIVTVAFVGGTLVNVGSLDQVRDFGRYFVPVLVLTLPIACQRLLEFLDGIAISVPSQRKYTMAAVILASSFWAAYPWTRSYELLSRPWHLQIVRYQRIGETIKQTLSKDAVVMAFHPWEVHMYSDRRTVLMPRNLDPYRILDEVRTYGVTHIVLDRKMGSALPKLAEQLRLTVDIDALQRDEIVVSKIGGT